VTAQFYVAVSILESEVLASELEAMVCKVMDDDKKKKRIRERTPLFIGKKGRESAFAYRTRSAGNEIAPVK